MMYDVESDKMSALSSNVIRNLKEDLYASLIDSDRVGSVLSDITSRVDLRLKENKRDKLGVADYKKEKMKRKRKNSRKSHEKDDKPKEDKPKDDKPKDEKLKNRKFSKSDLKALKRTLKEESLKNKKVLNDLINASNNHIREVKKIQNFKRSRCARREASSQRDSISKSYPQLDVNDISRLIKTPEDYDLKYDAENKYLKYDLRNNELNYDFGNRDFKIDYGNEDFRHLLERKYSMLGLEGTRKELLDYSGMMSSKMDNMLGYLQSDVGRIDRNNNNYDYLSGLVSSCRGSPFPLEHLQDSNCDLFSVGFTTPSSLPFDINTSSLRNCSPFPSCRRNSAFSLGLKHPRFSLDSNNSSLPLDMNNSANCDSYALVSFI